MMKDTEMRIEELENDGYVVVNLITVDGQVVAIEMSDGTEEVVAFEVVTVDEYEANGYEVEGLETTTIEF